MKKIFLDKLITISNAEVCFSLEQYRAYNAGEVTVSDVYLLNKLDLEIGQLSNRAYKMLVTTIATTILFIEKSITANASPLDGIDTLGWTMLSMFQKIGYWIALVMCLKELVQTLMKGGKCTEEVFGIIAKYAIIFAAMFFVPMLFNEIRNAFASM